MCSVRMSSDCARLVTGCRIMSAGLITRIGCMLMLIPGVGVSLPYNA